MDYVLDIIDTCGSEQDKYMTPKGAKGYCMISSVEVCNKIGWEDVELIYTRHYNNPDGRWLEMQQHSDHFAVYVPEDGLVLDYTMRQFDPATPFPYVGTIAAWTNLLSIAWEHQNLVVTTGKLCTNCQKVGNLCTCCTTCGEPPHVCACTGALTWVFKKFQESA